MSSKYKSVYGSRTKNHWIEMNFLKTKAGSPDCKVKIVTFASVL